MTNRLFDILDGIVSDNGGTEAAESLGSINTIASYADAAGDDITVEEAELIQSVGKRWLHEREHGNGEWSRMRHEAIAALETVEIDIQDPWSKEFVTKDFTTLTQDRLDAYALVMSDESREAVNDDLNAEVTPGRWLAMWALRVGPEEAGRVILGS